MEITILVESTDPLIGQVVATIGDRAGNTPRTEINFMGWVGLLRALDDLIGCSSTAPRSRSNDE